MTVEEDIRLTEKRMQLNQFTFNREHVPQYPLYGIKMPKSWCDFFRKHELEPFVYKFKLHTIGEKLQGAYPDILFTSFTVKELTGQTPFVVSVEKYPLQDLWLDLLYWFQVHIDGIDVLKDIPDDIRDAKLRWEPFAEEMMEAPYVYHLVPALFAYDTVQKGLHLSLDQKASGISLAYHLVHDHRISGAEIMSEPQAGVKGSKGTSKTEGLYSYLLRFNVVTKPGYDEYFLNVRTGIRRFIMKSPLNRDENLSSLRKGQHSIYVSFRKDRKGKRAFVPLRAKPISWDRPPFTAWQSTIDQVAVNYYLHRRDLHPDEIYYSPETYAAGQGNVRALICFNQYLNRTFIDIKPGVGFIERKGLFHSVLNHRKGVRQAETSARLSIASVRQSKFGFQSPGKANPTGISRIESRQVLYHPHPPEAVYLEVWSSSRSFFEQTLHVIKKKIFPLHELETKTQTNESVTYAVHYPLKQSSGANHLFDLTVIYREANGLTSDLEYGGSKGEKKRVKDIRYRLSEIHFKDPGLALIDIPSDYKNHKRYRRRKYDPKRAIRTGMLKGNRITQFIVTEDGDETTLESKLESGLYDLFSDKGFYRNTFHSMERVRATFVGLDYLKLGKRFIPIMTKSQRGQVQVKMPGLLDEWTDRDQAIITMSQRLLAGKLPAGPHERMVQFFRDNIYQLLKNSDDYLFVYGIYSLRLNYKPFQNGSLREGCLPFATGIGRYDQRLRVIRVNVDEYEIPQYIIAEKENPYIDGEGLFPDKRPLYYSIGKKSRTMKSGKKSDVRFHSATANIRIRRPVEFYICGGKSKEENDEIAMISHYLRSVPLTFDGAVLRPDPLYRTEKIKKYVKEIIPYAESDDPASDSVVGEAELLVNP